jgi:hypothetical protein
MTARKILDQANEDSFVFLLQSATELVFYKDGVPKLSPDGFTLGCTIYSATALKLLEDALRDGTPIRRNGDATPINGETRREDEPLQD